MDRNFAALAAATLLLAVACADDAATAPMPPGASSSPGADTPSPSPSAAAPSMDPEGELCLLVADVGKRLAALRAVELTLPNRVALDIELDKLQTAFGELEQAEMGELEDELEASLTRLGYRLGELELAVEDFRTTSRTRKAAPHVEEDSQKVADELGAFVILSRCR
jgi:hypothetical protein